MIILNYIQSVLVAVGLIYFVISAAVFGFLLTHTEEENVGDNPALIARFVLAAVSWPATLRAKIKAMRKSKKKKKRKIKIELPKE